MDQEIKFLSLQDMLGQLVDFETHKVDAIDSDITNNLAHKVAIHYITAWLPYSK